jgi:hypothetical protein
MNWVAVGRALIIDRERSVQLAKKRDMLMGINPSFENNTNVVPVSPSEAAFAN